MRRSITLITLALSLLAATISYAQTPPAADAKADQVLQQARAALGSEATLKGLQGLSAYGTLHRTFGELEMERVIEYDIQFPDQFRRTESKHPFTTLTVMEGDAVGIRQIPTPSDELGQPVKENEDPRVQARRRAAQRADFSRMALGWLLMAPSFEPVEYSYAGESKEGGALTDMLDVKGRGNFRVRLYVDQKTHRVVALSFRSKKLFDVMRMMSNVPGGPQSSSAEAGALTPEQQEKRRQEEENWRKAFQEALAKAPEVERRLVFSKFKNVGGLMLPHQLTKYEDGMLFEKWEIARFKLNPKFAPGTFNVAEKQ